VGEKAHQEREIGRKVSAPSTTYATTAIAIDGPAGAGKSTLGARLAQQLGYLYFDTGVMYRALTLIALREGLNLSDGPALEDLARRIVIAIDPPDQDDDRQYTVRAQGDDITWAIRSPEVDRNVSLASSYPGVRHEMVARQRAIGLRGRVVMVGRDIGTVVMPDAGLKIFLETSLDERARRRSDEQRTRGSATELSDVRDDLARRDALDRHVMQPASDALLLHTDGLSLDDEVAWIMNHIRQRT
jgi:CMP/dCMP kinase